MACDIVANYKPKQRLSETLSEQQNTPRMSLFADSFGTFIYIPTATFSFNMTCTYSCKMDSLFAVFKLYLKVGKPLVYAALNGYKGTLLTYGQTGTGIVKKQHDKNYPVTI